MNVEQVISRIFLAALLGGIVGFERELYRHEAGLRTHILVSVGSTLIMLTSLYVFDIYKMAGVDPTRIAANVVSGIGFICAGTIIRYGMEIRGLTTAATLWMTAAVGLAVGCGFYIAAILATLVAIIALIPLRTFEKKLITKKEK